MLSSSRKASFSAILIVVSFSGCQGGKSSGDGAETAAAEPGPARPSESFVGKSTGSAATLLKHLRELDAKYIGAKQDDVETSHANLLAYSQAMEQTADALVANKAFPKDARLTGAKVKLKSIRDRLDVEPKAFDQFLAAADKLEQEETASTIPQLAAFARFDTVANAPMASFANARDQLEKTVDALVRLANVEPPLPETADLLEHFGLVTELRDEPKRSAMLFELLGKRFPEHPLMKFAPGSVHRLELRGKEFTEVKGKDFDGKPVDVKDFRGKIVLVDFWASWCKPCIEEMSNLKEMRRTLEPMGFEIVGVCIDENARQGQFAVESMKIPWPQIYDERGADGFSSKLALGLGIGKIPHKLLINGNGVLVASGVDLKELAPAVSAALKVQATNKLAEIQAAKAKKSASPKDGPDASKKPENGGSPAAEAAKKGEEKP